MRRRIGLLVSSLLLMVRCQCGDDPLGALPIPQIDVCVAPTPGSPEVCYEAEKVRREAELCASGECVRPELTADMGLIPAGVEGSVSVRVRNTGTGDLYLCPHGSSFGWSLAPAQQGASDNECDAGNAYLVIAAETDDTFAVERSANTCGVSSLRLVLASNDQPDSPVYLNLTGEVGGPCLGDIDCGPPPFMVDFGTVAVDTTATRTFTFKSCGTEAVQITSTVIGIDAANVFDIVGQSYTDGDSLQPGDVATVSVTFTPRSAQPYGGQAWLHNNTYAYSPYHIVNLVGAGGIPDQCQLAAIPASSNFGVVPRGNSGTSTFLIRNTGELTCALRNTERTAGSAEFNIVLGSVTPPAVVSLAPDQSHRLDITYAPGDNSSDTATFTVTADDVNAVVATATISVTGTAEVPEGCVLSVSPNFLDFGDVTIGGTPPSQTISLTHIGTSNGFTFCEIDSSTLVFGSPDFRISGVGGIPCILNPSHQCLFPNQAASLTVTFDPQSEGQKSGLVRLDTNDVSRPPNGIIDVPLSGNAAGSQLCVTVEGVNPATVQCTATQPCATFNFGSVAANFMTSGNITLTNCGSGVLTVRGLPMDPAGGLAFARTSPTANQIPFSLAANASRTVTIQYRPTSISGDLSAFDVLSNASNAPQARVALQGNYGGDCAIACQPSALNFGSQEIGTANLRSVICSNFGSATTNITSVSVTGDPSLTLRSPTLASLDPGDGFPVQVQCLPATTGQKNATVTIFASACGPITVPVSCTGIDPPLQQCIGSQTFQPIQKWHWNGQGTPTNYVDVWVTPVVINLTDDNADGVVDSEDVPEVIFTAFDSDTSALSGTSLIGVNDPEPAVVVAVNGATGAVRWTWGWSNAASTGGALPTSDGDPNAMCAQAEASLAAGDIDADGLPEIVGVKYTYIPPNECEASDFQCQVEGRYVYGSLFALEHDGTFKWESEKWHQSESVIEDASAVAIGDINGDGLPEIAFGNAVFDRNGLLVFEGANDQGEGNPGWGAVSIFADLTGDNINDLVAGCTAYRGNGQVLWNRCVDSALGEAIYDANAAIANVDNDPQPEVVLLDGWNDLYVLDHDGRTKYGPVHISSGNVDDSGNEEGFIPTHPAVGDVDNDGLPEIVIAATNYIHVYEHNLAQKWQMAISDQTGASGPTTFDFEGDHAAEVVHADENDVWVWNGTDGAVKYQADRTSRTIVDNPVVADVDNDGQADVLTVLEMPLPGGGGHGVRLYNNDKANWVGTRRIWNQHSYHITNVSESGIVPAFEGSGWLQHNVYRSNVVRCE